MILIDTHVVVWLAFDEDRISRAATHAITQARKDGVNVAVSGATLLELAGLARKRQYEIATNLQEFLEDVERRFCILPITARAAARSAELPTGFPKDPIDRILAATAIVEGLSLVTADREIRRSGAVRTIW